MKDQNDRTLVLAGDIGGTKTNMGLFTQGRRRPLAKVIDTFSSKDALHLEQIIKRFLEKHPVHVAGACFGIAGPVVNGRCKTTNLPWIVSEKRIKARFGWPHVLLINDLTSTALSIPLLMKRELLSLNHANTLKGRDLALLAPGTGLGQAFLIFRNGRYLTMASEGGHADFSPNSEREVALWQYLKKHYGHVSIERVLSGAGLANIYAFLKKSGQFKELSRLSKKGGEIDRARAITEGALKEGNRLCVVTLNMFASILGSVAGNLALTGMTTGGVYLGGGIPPKILPVLQQNTFIKAFEDKGRFRGFMEKIPVNVIMNEKAALLGAAHCAFQRLMIS
jgi:glucokinase